MESLNWNRLLSIDSPWAYFVACAEDRIANLVLRQRDREDRFVVRILRGERCPNERRLFKEWAAVLQFPDYFGNNWDALQECLADLEWLPAPGYVLIITNVDALLRGQDRAFQILLEILDTVSKEWATPVPPDVWWTRPAIPFRVVFHSKPENEEKGRQRLERAGIKLLAG